MYIDILKSKIWKHHIKAELENNFVSQYDNDPKYKAKITQTFFKSSRMKVLDQPPQSSDLNPIENL